MSFARPLFLAAVALMFLGGRLEASAQMRSVVIPSDSGVVVPSRSQATPRLAAPPAASAEAQDAAEDYESVNKGREFSALAPLMVIVPAIAGAVLGGSLAGSGQGGGAPTRTR